MSEANRATMRRRTPEEVKDRLRRIFLDALRRLDTVPWDRLETDSSDQESFDAISKICADLVSCLTQFMLDMYEQRSDDEPELPSPPKSPLSVSAEEVRECLGDSLVASLAEAKGVSGDISCRSTERLTELVTKEVTDRLNSELSRRSDESAGGRSGSRSSSRRSGRRGSGSGSGSGSGDKGTPAISKFFNRRLNLMVKHVAAVFKGLAITITCWSRRQDREREAAGTPEGVSTSEEERWFTPVTPFEEDPLEEPSVGQVSETDVVTPPAQVMEDESRPPSPEQVKEDESPVTAGEASSALILSPLAKANLQSLVEQYLDQLHLVNWQGSNKISEEAQFIISSLCVDILNLLTKYFLEAFKQLPSLEETCGEASPSKSPISEQIRDCLGDIVAVTLRDAMGVTEDLDCTSTSKFTNIVRKELTQRVSFELSKHRSGTSDGGKDSSEGSEQLISARFARRLKLMVKHMGAILKKWASTLTYMPCFGANPLKSVVPGEKTFMLCDASLSVGNIESRSQRPSVASERSAKKGELEEVSSDEMAITVEDEAESSQQGIDVRPRGSRRTPVVAFVEEEPGEQEDVPVLILSPLTKTSLQSIIQFYLDQLHLVNWLGSNKISEEAQIIISYLCVDILNVLTMSLLEAFKQLPALGEMYAQAGPSKSPISDQVRECLGDIITVTLRDAMGVTEDIDCSSTSKFTDIVQKELTERISSELSRHRSGTSDGGRDSSEGVEQLISARFAHRLKLMVKHMRAILKKWATTLTYMPCFATNPLNSVVPGEKMFMVCDASLMVGNVESRSQRPSVASERSAKRAGRGASSDEKIIAVDDEARLSDQGIEDQPQQLKRTPVTPVVQAAAEKSLSDGNIIEADDEPAPTVRRKRSSGSDYDPVDLFSIDARKFSAAEHEASHHRFVHSIPKWTGECAPMMIKALVHQILKKSSDVTRSCYLVNEETIQKNLLSMFWADINMAEIIVRPDEKTFKKIAKAVDKDLCKAFGGKHMVQFVMVVEPDDTLIYNRIMKCLKTHLTTSRQSGFKRVVNSMCAFITKPFAKCLSRDSAY